MLSEFEQRRCEKLIGAFVESRRPPVAVRSKVDVGFRISGQSVEIFTIRPRFDDPKQQSEDAVAKATFVKSTGRWRIFWKRADLKWHRYDPMPEASSLEAFVEVLREDEHSCFWG